VPSLLRGFSAPVRLSDDVSAEELGILAAFDSDSFNRYEACQRLAHNILAAEISGAADRKSEEALINALRLGLADTSRRDDFKALCFSVPGQADTEQRATPADPPEIFAKRLALQARLGSALASDIKPIISATSHLEQAAGRSLQNKLLGLLCASGDETALDIALAQSENLNMSLSMGGLQALNHTDHANRGRALDSFYKRWNGAALVIEKWLMLSASSAVHGNIANIKALMQDPVFDASNPNKLRSVLGVFAAANPVHFHKSDGSGYRFIAEELVSLDKRNPQIAARMGLTLTRFSNYGAERQQQMRDAVRFVAGHALSRDLNEVISKALKSA
jgi:aminopeptidase N